MTDDRPDILLVMTDQWRGDCLGIEDHPVLQTPHVDHLARSGTWFRRGYSACPSCIPARRSLMTGTAPAANGMVGFVGDDTWKPPTTLPRELGRAGYQTHLVGKLHLQPEPRRYGFDFIQLADGTRGEHNAYVEWLRTVHGRTEQDPGMMHGVTANGWVGRPHTLPEEQMHTFWCFDQAIRFLREYRDPACPLFLKISTIDPHPPCTPPAFYYDRYIHRDLPEPVVGDWADDVGGAQKGLDPDASRVCLDRETMRCCRAAYYGMCNFVDDQLGRLRQIFGRALDETLIIFTSDHGEMLGDHNLYRKCWPYEASARVPFVIRPPRSWDCPNEIVCDTPVDLQDLMPTILDAAGIGIPTTCTGRSLAPILRGETDRVRDVLHGEHAGCYAYEDGNHWLTDGGQKYVWYSQTGREHLFDLKADPDECHDLAADESQADRIKVWRRTLMDVLRGRPEGFTDGERLIAGKTHTPLMPGYDPQRVTAFL